MLYALNTYVYSPVFLSVEYSIPFHLLQAWCLRTVSNPITRSSSRHCSLAALFSTAAKNLSQAYGTLNHSSLGILRKPDSLSEENNQSPRINLQSHLIFAKIFFIFLCTTSLYSVLGHPVLSISLLQTFWLHGRCPFSPYGDQSQSLTLARWGFFHWSTPILDLFS